MSITNLYSIFIDPFLRDIRTYISKFSGMKRVVKNKGFLIFIDFQVPLPSTIISYLVKAIEYFAGRNHYECFKGYLKQGGLDSILNRN